MEENEIKNDDYITLKEAGELSGYSADYIGQLIRKGKISGKQVYMNVAWVTTEDAVREYFANEGRGKRGEKEESAKSALSQAKVVDRTLDTLFSAKGEMLLKVILYSLLAIGVAIIIGLFYVFVISIDHAVSERSYKQNIQGGAKLMQYGAPQSRLPVEGSVYAQR